MAIEKQANGYRTYNDNNSPNRVEQDDAEAEPKLFPSIRLLNCFLVFLGCTCNSASFATFNFALVCFINSTATTATENGSGASGNETHSISNCPSVTTKENSVTLDYGGDINWSRASQVNAIAAWGWSAFVLTLPCGYLIHRLGSKTILLIAHSLCSLSGLLIPFTVSQGEWFTFVLRLIGGAMANGVGWPCIMHIVARWASKKEAGLLKGLCSSGFPLGVVVAYVVSGVACSFGPHGWQYAVYTVALLNASILIPIAFCFADSPEASKLVSGKELRFILQSRSLQKKQFSKETTESEPAADETSAILCAEKTEPIPFRQMLTSLPVLVTINSSLCLGWSASFTGNFAPAYMKEVLALDPTTNGLLSPLPSIAQFVGQLAFGSLSDVAATTFSQNTAVRLFDGMALGVPALMYLALSGLDCQNVELAVTCLTLCLFFLSATVAGFFKSIYYIASKHASTVTAIVILAAGLPGILVPYMVGAILSKGTLAEWRTTLYIAAAINAWGVLFFALFGSGTEQEWASGQSDASLELKARHRGSVAPVSEGAPKPTRVEH